MPISLVLGSGIQQKFIQCVGKSILNMHLTDSMDKLHCLCLESVRFMLPNYLHIITP